jgi:hypothetical protein
MSPPGMQFVHRLDVPRGSLGGGMSPPMERLRGHDLTLLAYRLASHLRAGASLRTF